MFGFNGSLVLITWACCYINGQFKYNRISVLGFFIQILLAFICHVSCFYFPSKDWCNSVVSFTNQKNCSVQAHILFGLPKCLLQSSLGPSLGATGCYYCWISMFSWTVSSFKTCWVARFIMPVLHEPFCIGIRGDRSSAGGRTKNWNDRRW